MGALLINGHPPVQDMDDYSASPWPTVLPEVDFLTFLKSISHFMSSSNNLSMVHLLINVHFVELSMETVLLACCCAPTSATLLGSPL